MRSQSSGRARLWFALVAGVLIAGTVATPAVAAPDFQILVSPSSQSLNPGTSVSFFIEIGSIDGFSDLVTLSVDGLPPTVSSVFTTNPVTPDGTSFLQLTAAPNAGEGTFPIAITATSGAITHVANGQATVDFGLIPVCFGNIQGTITDADTGDPIQDVVVSIFPDIRTDAEGHYELPHQALGLNNSPMDVVVSGQKTPNYWSGQGEGVLLCDETTTIDFTMVRVRPARLSGTVVVGTVVPPDYDTVVPTSTPIEGAQVCAYNWTCQDEPTGPDGAFDFSFPLAHNNQPLFLYLTASQQDESSATPWRTGYWYEYVWLDQVDPDEHVAQDIALVKKCTGSISGTVVDGSTNEPVADVWVNAWLSNVDSAWDQTDANGVFEFPELLLNHNNAPATYLVSASAGGGPFATPALDECGDHAEVPLELDHERSATIEGLVLDEESLSPIEGAWVTWCLSCPSVLTDATGHYELEVNLGFSDEPNDISILAGKDPYWQQEHPPIVEDVLPNQTRTASDVLLLLRRYGAVAGVVRDSITHAPIPDASVLSFDGASSGVLSDPDGRYEVDHIQLQYRNQSWSPEVRASAPGYWPVQVPVEVRADRTSPFDFELLPICQNATISGRVVNAVTLEPIEGADVFGIGFGTKTDANGQYIVHDVQVGTNNQPLDVSLTAFAPGFHPQTRQVTVFCGGVISLNFGPPPPTSSLEGFVTDISKSPGTPIPGVLIGGAFGQTTTTDGDGYYRFDDVPLDLDGSPLTWDVTAFPDGFEQQTKSVEVRANEVARLDFTFGETTDQRGTIVVEKHTMPAGSDQSFTLHTPCGDLAISDGGTVECRFAGEGSISEAAADDFALSDVTCDDGTPFDRTLPGVTVDLDPGEIVHCTFTNAAVSEGVDHLSLQVKAGRSVIYSLAGALSLGDYDVDPATGSPSSISGTGTLASAAGSGSATVSFSLLFDSSTRRWSGMIVVNDPEAGFAASIAVSAGRQAIMRDGTTTSGVVKGLKALSTPKKAYAVVFEIDDLA